MPRHTQGHLPSPRRLRWRRLLTETGTLRTQGFDQTTNVILDECHERVFSTTAGVEQAAAGPVTSLFPSPPHRATSRCESCRSTLATPSPVMLNTVCIPRRARWRHVAPPARERREHRCLRWRDLARSGAPAHPETPPRAPAPLAARSPTRLRSAGSRRLCWGSTSSEGTTSRSWARSTRRSTPRSTLPCSRRSRSRLSSTERATSLQSGILGQYVKIVIVYTPGTSRAPEGDPAALISRAAPVPGVWGTEGATVISALPPAAAVAGGLDCESSARAPGARGGCARSRARPSPQRRPRRRRPCRSRRRARTSRA